MNQTCQQLRDALDAGADCRFALVDALEESGEVELAELYEHRHKRSFSILSQEPL